MEKNLEDHDEYMQAIMDQELMLVAPRSSQYHNDLVRICELCGEYVFIRPYSAKVEKIICSECFARGQEANYEAALDAKREDCDPAEADPGESPDRDPIPGYHLALSR